MSKRPFDFEEAEEADEFYTNTDEAEETTTNAQPPHKKNKYTPKKCEHGKQKAYCRECGGSAFCEHGKRKRYCKQCGGSQICKHDKIKSDCRLCDGSSFCEHEKHKRHCKDCNGSQVCEHGKRKQYCKQCGGSAFCEHGKHKIYCKDCYGSQICEHGKIKARCKQCDGSAFCQHGKHKMYCKECDGSQICEHGKVKYRCKQCGGSGICEHGKGKAYCKQCGGSALCKHEWCDIRKSKDGYCTRCFVKTFPDAPYSRNYKTKEKSVTDFVTETFPNFTWSIDRRVPDGCSKRRPDLMLDLGSHVIIVEIDENQHTDYDTTCEISRINELFIDVSFRSIVFIRFNPDDYIDSNGMAVKSCWKINKTSGILVLNRNKIEEWNARLERLREQIQYWIDNCCEEPIKSVHLFYDCN